MWIYNDLEWESLMKKLNPYGVRGGGEIQEGGDVCTPMADLSCSMAETNTIL